MGLLEYSFGMIELAMGTDGLLLHGFDRFSAEFSLMAIRRNMVRAMLLFGFGAWWKDQEVEMVYWETICKCENEIGLRLRLGFIRSQSKGLPSFMRQSGGCMVSDV